jgi:hypothetical protein
VKVVEVEKKIEKAIYNDRVKEKEVPIEVDVVNVKVVEVLKEVEKPIVKINYTDKVVKVP